MPRDRDFGNISKAISASAAPHCINSHSLVVQGDSLSILGVIPDHSVSLILTDPPYHSTKKRNIFGDTTFKEDQCYLEWMSRFGREWARVLRPNGSLFCFCSPAMSGRLESVLSTEFNILSRIVWTKPNDPGFDGWKQKMNKESLRRWYDHSERILFAEPAVTGNLFRSSLGKVLKERRVASGLTSKALAEAIGAYGKVNHGGAVSNWEAGRNTPNREQYERICRTLQKKDGTLSMPAYEDIVRPFNVDKTKEFTDIWSFQGVRPYPRKHPAEKPISLLEHAISATTYPGDIVLDCFAGSGSTAIAALKLGRYSISVEIEGVWYRRIADILRLIEDKGYCEFPGQRGSDSRALDTQDVCLFSQKCLPLK